jgi:thiol-disulfide isomerase/thioredoxin
MKFNKLAMSLLFAGMLILSGCGSSDSSSSTPPAAPPPVDNPAPPTTPGVGTSSVTTIDGETISFTVTEVGFKFAGYEGKPVLLEIYGDTCPHCIGSIPMYNSLQAKYGNDILILTINDGGTWTTLDNAGLQAYAAARGMQYRTVSRELSGNIRSYVEGFGPIAGVPYLLILDKNGEIVVPIVGDVDEATLEAYILDLL